MMRLDVEFMLFLCENNAFSGASCHLCCALKMVWEQPLNSFPVAGL